MICVARRVTAVERTESFNTRHELSGEEAGAPMRPLNQRRRHRPALTSLPRRPGLTPLLMRSPCSLAPPARPPPVLPGR